MPVPCPYTGFNLVEREIKTILSRHWFSIIKENFSVS